MARTTIGQTIDLWNWNNVICIVDINIFDLLLYTNIIYILHKNIASLYKTKNVFSISPFKPNMNLMTLILVINKTCITVMSFGMAKIH